MRTKDTMNTLNCRSLLSCSAAVAVVYFAMPVAPTGARGMTTCEHLKSMQLPSTTITASDLVEGGAFNSANARGFDYKTLPAFCRVQGVIAPLERFAHRIRGLDAGVHLEREIPGGWKRRVRG
jgi:hypothetical protein